MVGTLVRDELDPEFLAVCPNKPGDPKEQVHSLWVSLRKGGVLHVVGNVCRPPLPSAPFQDLQQASAQVLARFAGRPRPPELIIGGGFNCTPSSWLPGSKNQSLATEQAFMRFADDPRLVQINDKTKKTKVNHFCAPDSTLCSPCLEEQAKTGQTLEIHATSDHLPIAVEFELPKAQSHSTPQLVWRASRKMLDNHSTKFSTDLSVASRRWHAHHAVAQREVESASGSTLTTRTLLTKATHDLVTTFIEVAVQVFGSRVNNREQPNNNGEQAIKLSKISNNQTAIHKKK